MLNVPTHLLVDIGLIIIVGTLMGYLARLLRQPFILAYVLSGFVLGPIGLGLIQDLDVIRALSEIGIVFLLFIVGLEIDLKKLKSVGYVSFFGGIIQVLITFISVYLISLFLIGLGNIEAIYAGLILAFSSTAIVIKLLSDKSELDTLHGKILLGILILQDLLAVFALSALDTFNSFSILAIGIQLSKVILFILIAYYAGRIFLPSIFEFAASSQELLFLSAITICFLFSYLAVVLGFSIAIGAFLAGVALANLPYNYNLIGKIRPLKDFFATIFFVCLGMQLVLINGNLLKPLLIFFVLAVLFKPLLIMIIVSLFGYEKRTSFLTANSLGQVSEFSLIILSVGFYNLKQISQEFFSLMVFLTVMTMVLTSYLIKHDAGIYKSISSGLAIFEKLSLSRHKKLEYIAKKDIHNIIIFGCHRMGSVFVKTFEKIGNILVVDYDPDVIQYLINKKISAIYGDTVNVDVLRRINFKKARIVISTIVNQADSLFLINYVKKKNKNLVVIVTSNHINDALDLYDNGADYVILPRVSTAERISELIKDLLIKKKKNLKDVKKKHINHLLHLDKLSY